MLTEVDSHNQKPKQNRCIHLAQAPENTPTTLSEWQERRIEGASWLALPLRGSCGHVGCCDSSPGKHATRHFMETDHLVMMALPDKAQRWYHIHKAYG
ncbi:MAG TPA: UBP-type zinc finger domain-containing protein [Nitrososphaera sp.]|nr:UBP-type zinc finger domain-containing protein [Nitrososphaera sp.]